MVTHDLASLASICDRIAALAHGTIVACGPLSSMRETKDPWVRQYFGSRRGEQMTATQPI
jgi:phospholipid/cholesterol/gamma-HCH transport system ATP-binding protein